MICEVIKQFVMIAAHFNRKFAHTLTTNVRKQRQQKKLQKVAYRYRYLHIALQMSNVP